MDYWKTLDQLVLNHKLIIDRPKSSEHPLYPDSIYPIDYGYLEGTVSADGHGIDVWIGSLENKMVQAVLNTVDTRTKIMETRARVVKKYTQKMYELMKQKSMLKKELFS